ncbi:hypothetical protein Tco_1492427 [Tanacetum coccineum]
MYPVLSRMAMDIISVQASSVASESAFSTSGRVLSIRRTRLTPASLEMCMCLKDHLDAKERKQDKSPLEIPLDFEEDVLDDEVQRNEAIPLSDEEIALDASSEGTLSPGGPRYRMTHTWFRSRIEQDASVKRKLTGFDFKFQNPGIQNVENMNGLSVVPEIANQYGNGNFVTAPDEGNGNGINGNPIRCYNCQGEGYYASNCIVKSRKRDAGYLQQQLQIAQEEEVGIQSTQEEFEFMTTADAHEETERVKVKCTLDDTLQQAFTSGTQSDNAPVYDSDGSTEVPKDENCYDHDIFNMLTHEVQYTGLQTELDQCKYDKILYDKAYNDMKQKIERLQAQLGDLKEFQVQNYAKENEHLKTTYKNPFDSIKVTQAQTNSIIDSLQKQLYDTIYENAKLRAHLFDKVSEQKGTTKGTRTNTMLTKQSILGKPPSSSYKPKLYSVTPFPKSSVLPKVDKTNAFSKPVSSNSVPSTRKSKVVQTINVIAPRIFRSNPSKTSRVDNVVPNKPVKTSVRIKPITVSQPNVIHKQQANSDSNGFSSTRVNNTAKTRSPRPRRNSNTDRVPSKSKSSCLSNNVEKIEEHHRNS